MSMFKWRTKKTHSQICGINNIIQFLVSNPYSVAFLFFLFFRSTIFFNMHEFYCLMSYCATHAHADWLDCKFHFTLILLMYYSRTIKYPQIFMYSKPNPHSPPVTHHTMTAPSIISIRLVYFYFWGRHKSKMMIICWLFSSFSQFLKAYYSAVWTSSFSSSW